MMQLYHFLKVEHAVNTLENGWIKVATFDDLNDPFELMCIDSMDESNKYQLDEIKEFMNDKYGLLCFSKSRKNPVIWSHYADRHKGVCLGFNINCDNVIKVEYVRDRIKHGNYWSNAIDDAVFHKLVRTKYSHWRYEGEWRILVKLDDCQKDKNNLYFKKFDESMRVNKILFGPRISDSDKAKCIAQIEINKISMSDTRLSDKYFRVVINRHSRKIINSPTNRASRMK